MPFRFIVKVFLAEDSEVREGEAQEVEFFGRSVILARRGGRVKVYAKVCTHLGGLLSLDGEVLRSAWHGASFEPGTGKAIGGPASPDSRLMRLPFRLEEGKIFYVYGEGAGSGKRREGKVPHEERVSKGSPCAIPPEPQLYLSGGTRVFVEGMRDQALHLQRLARLLAP